MAGDQARLILEALVSRLAEREGTALLVAGQVSAERMVRESELRAGIYADLREDLLAVLKDLP